VKKLNKIIFILLAVIALTALFTVKAQAATPTVNDITFDARYYANKYPDLAKGYGAYNYEGLKSHYVNYGIKEGRQASPYFDVKYYAAKYPDLAKAYGNDYTALYNHFVNYGISEGRQGSASFDVKYYVSAYSDLAKAYGTKYESLYNHYINYGIYEGRLGVAAKATTNTTTTHEHTWVAGDVKIEATCVSNGAQEYTCTCGETKIVLTDALSDTKDHKWNDGVETTSATCGKDGVKTYTCTICKATRTDVIPATEEHVYQIKYSTADCETAGTVVSVCKVCNDVKVEENVIAHDFSKYTITSAGHQAECSNCGVKQPIEDHVYIGAEAVVTEDDDENHILLCVVCGEQDSSKVSAKEEPHTFGTYTAATVTVNQADIAGHYATCTACGYKLAEAHRTELTDEEENANVEVQYKTTATTHAAICLDCGAETKAEDHITSNDYTIVDDNGTSKHAKKCDNCGVIVNSTIEAHTYNNGEFVDNGDGTHSPKCDNCDYVDKTVEATEHEYDSYAAILGDKHTATCKDCGYVLTEAHIYNDVGDDKVEYADTEDADTHTPKCLRCEFVGNAEAHDFVNNVTYKAYGDEEDVADLTGTHYAICKCGTENKDVTSAHNYVTITADNLADYEEEIEAVEAVTLTLPTLYADGYNIYVCSDCGHVAYELVHTFTGSTTYLPNDDGSTHSLKCKYYDSDDDKDLGVSSEKINHNFGDITVSTVKEIVKESDHIAVYEATCEDCGYTQYYTDEKGTIVVDVDSLSDINKS
jgi:predicted nucleic-acid-binding Zn-ribbon protein